MAEGTYANFHGVKGKSGRKSARVELAKDKAIREAWLKVAANVNTADVKDIALPLALKDMVAKVGNPDGSQFTPQTVLVKFLDETNGKGTANNRDTR